jgi:glutaminyl-peptide cyclotransferase
MLTSIVLTGLFLAAAAPSAKPADSPATAAAKPPVGAKTSASAARAVPGFDSTRAFRYLREQCDLGPRNPGSEGHARAIDYFTAHFSKLGFAVEKQAFTHIDMHTKAKVPLTNIIVTVKGKDPKRKPVIYCAHRDTRPRADKEAGLALRERPILGANDGASGVAVLMELANLFKAMPPRHPVYIVLFDGEDYGREGGLEEYFLGAKYFADHLPAKEFGYALLLDMVGDKDLKIQYEPQSLAKAGDLVRRIWEIAKGLGLTAFEPVTGALVYDDHVPLQAKGIAAIDIIDFDYPPWHTLSDTPDKCSAHSLGVVGTLVAHLAYKGFN